MAMQRKRRATTTGADRGYRFGFKPKTFVPKLHKGVVADQKPVAIELEGIIVVVGNFGSGKTEVAINLAAERKKDGAEVRVADLDLVNPYFRTREARRLLTDLGIDLVHGGLAQPAAAA